MNKPVAYVTGVRQFDAVSADTVLKVGTPLYTHPVKELTEEMAKDLANLYVEQYGHPFPAVSYAMAIQQYLKGELDLLAILRKAQEK